MTWHLAFTILTYIGAVALVYLSTFTVKGYGRFPLDMRCCSAVVNLMLTTSAATVAVLGSKSRAACNLT